MKTSQKLLNNIIQNNLSTLTCPDCNTQLNIQEYFSDVSTIDYPSYNCKCLSLKTFAIKSLGEDIVKVKTVHISKRIKVNNLYHRVLITLYSHGYLELQVDLLKDRLGLPSKTLLELNNIPFSNLSDDEITAKEIQTAL